jgi:hypothetical protein
MFLVSVVSTPPVPSSPNLLIYSVDVTLQRAAHEKK